MMNIGFKGFTNCIDCKKRYPGCHSKCESYINDRKDLDEFKEKVWKEKEKYKELGEYKKTSVNKTIRIKERKNKK